MKLNILVLLAGLALVACGGGAASSTTSTESESQAAETSGSEQQTAALVPIGQAQIGDRTTCPVSGEEFVVSESSPTAEHDGHTYYFCCPGCVERFQANPHQYLPEHHEESEAASES